MFCLKTCFGTCFEIIFTFFNIIFYISNTTIRTVERETCFDLLMDWETSRHFPLIKIYQFFQSCVWHVNCRDIWISSGMGSEIQLFTFSTHPIGSSIIRNRKNKLANQNGWVSLNSEKVKAAQDIFANYKHPWQEKLLKEHKRSKRKATERNLNDRK